MFTELYGLWEGLIIDGLAEFLSYSGLFSTEGAFIWASVLANVGLFLAIAIPTIALVLGYLLKGIALYNMAFKAGYDKPWLAFIPILSEYLAAILPMKEFSYLGMYKTYNRGKAFWVVTIVLFLAPLVLGFVIGIISAVLNLGLIVVMLFLPSSAVLGLMTALIALLRGVMTLAIRVAIIVFHVTLRVDLIELYLESGTAKVLGILSAFIIGMYPIVLISICKKKPAFGYGNYYTPVFMGEDDE